MTQQSEMNQAGQSESQTRQEGSRPEEGRQAYGKSAIEQTGRILRNLSQRVLSVAESLREEGGPSQKVEKPSSAWEESLSLALSTCRVRPQRRCVTTCEALFKDTQCDRLECFSVSDFCLAPRCDEGEFEYD